RGATRAFHRRPDAAQPAPRDFHRQRCGDGNCARLTCIFDSRFSILDWSDLKSKIENQKSKMNTPSIVRTNTAELYDAYVMKNYARAPLTLVRGRGVSVWDDTGREYLDFTSGVA